MFEALCQGQWIEAEDLPHEVAAVISVKLGDTIKPIKEVEHDYILTVLALCDGDKHKAAHALQMGFADGLCKWALQPCIENSVNIK
jgi:DNA-binding NtrC family response regulator